MYQKQCERVKKFPGGAPPNLPRYYVLMHMNLYTFAPPPLTLMKPHFAPLSHFLDEGLCINPQN